MKFSEFEKHFTKSTDDNSVLENKNSGVQSLCTRLSILSTMRTV